VEERFVGNQVTLRILVPDDCCKKYVDWLNDPLVNRYLETRWEPQSMVGVREFVETMVAATHSYLFAIIENTSGCHVGNIKIGPINPRHSFADVSYFIGDRSWWGRGLATEAIVIVTQLGFARLGLHRCQAGVYRGNGGSVRALVKAGYREEGFQRRQLLAAEGWEDHLWFGILKEEWDARSVAMSS